MYHNMEHADIIRKMTEEFDEVLFLIWQCNTTDGAIHLLNTADWFCLNQHATSWFCLF